MTSSDNEDLSPAGRDGRAETRAPVLIVGAGPCGLTIANLLGVYGVRTEIIDRAEGPIDYPRAVGVDDESLRAFQACGLADALQGDMVQNPALIWFDSALRKLVEVQPQGQPYGWPRRNTFLQPRLEAELRRGLDRLPHVQLRTSTELLELESRGSSVFATMQDGHKQEDQTETFEYVVGADGGRSTVRRLTGIGLEGSTLAHRWLVVDLKDSKVHAPYSGTYISARRPFVSIDLPYGYRRFEFRLNPDETDEQMLQPSAIESLIRKNAHWEGAMPGIERARVYSHHSRVASNFKAGRVFLAGDAAHLQPPWFGQGMNSGIRDAMNLAWKLAAVVQRGYSPAILETYDQERRSHARALVELATTLGRLYGPSTRPGEWFRSLGLRVLGRVPSARDYLTQAKFKPMPYYSGGLVVDAKPSGPVGKMFLQSEVETQDGRKLRLDDGLGQWFAVVGVNVDPLEYMSDDAKRYWEEVGASFVRINRSRAASHYQTHEAGTVLLDDRDGKIRDWSQANPNLDILFIRPDRYVAAASSTENVNEVTNRIAELLRPPAFRPEEG